MSARPLMVQGTMSSVGKSFLVAGLCRVLAQDGVRVAPFKSQNMALNSAVTREGLEMGRAQAMQAEAAGIEPEVAMNPVLLKPTTDVGSQVIVHGRPVGTMPAREYFAFRHTLKEPIMEAYRALARSYDVVLIEGAGSPVELNLKRDDIVNMGIAALCDAPVLLVGDIDRGGVFAQLVGTMMLLEPAERRRVKATVANKFRGDVTLFDEGIRILEEKTGVPVAGLVPYIQVDLDDEDSVSDRLERREHAGLVDVAVVRLPKISNFTDFNALEATGVACVRYVSEPQELGTPDLVVLPGTKATMADLAWLRSTGFDKAVGDAAQIGIPVLGICGGYQMLGLSISDPCGVEGGGETDGLGLLPIRTVFGTKKRTVRSRGRFLRAEGPLEGLSGMRVDGYEIHMGTTRLEGGSALVELIEADGTRRLEGCQTGNVYGCYLHGLFDDSQANRGLLQSLMSAKGLDGAEACAVDMKAYREGQYDMLAACIRAHLNMELIYEIIEKGAS